MAGLRRQLPVHSPLSWGQLAQGARACLWPEQDRERLVGQALCARYDASRVIATDSGTAALTLALAAASATAARPILLPAYGCFDLASAAVGARAPVSFYDVDPSTLGPDMAQLERLASRGTSAIVIAYVYGVPVDLEPIAALCRAQGAVLVEDAAQAHGGSWRGKRLGAHGDLSILSFGRGKGVTSGGGGALLIRSGGPAADRLNALGALAPASSARTVLSAAVHHLLGRPALFGLPSAIPWLGIGQTVYHAPKEPRALSAASFAMLEVALPRADALAEPRRARANALRARLPVSARVGERMVPGGIAGSLRLPALAPSAEARATLAASGARLGVAAGYPVTLPELPQLSGLVLPGESTSGARVLASRLLTLPTHDQLTEREMQEMTQWITASW